MRTLELAAGEDGDPHDTWHRLRDAIVLADIEVDELIAEPTRPRMSHEVSAGYQDGH